MAHRHWALTTLYAILVWASLHGGVVESGYAPHYRPGLMAQVSRRRDMPVVACMVSSPVHPLGAWLWVYGERTGALLHCRVTDISHPRDRARHIRTRRVVELDWSVTTQLCGSTRERAIDCPVMVIR